LEVALDGRVVVTAELVLEPTGAPDEAARVHERLRRDLERYGRYAEERCVATRCRQAASQAA